MHRQSDIWALGFRKESSFAQSPAAFLLSEHPTRSIHVVDCADRAHPLPNAPSFSEKFSAAVRECRQWRSAPDLRQLSVSLLGCFSSRP
jgi:hypothetical protein